MFSLLLVLIYVCFISLGLPDSLLGSAWPVLQEEIHAPMSYAGIVSTVISGGTIISSFFSDKLLRKFGAGKVTAFSVALTAIALFGFSISNRFWMLIAWSIPYGLGAGAVDAILNNYVALHYKPQHMSWLHCMWGIGASISPYIMSFSLVKLHNWQDGYLIVAVLQILLSVLIFTSIPLWNKNKNDNEEKDESLNPAPLTLREIFKIPSAIPCFLAFFAYCALEVTASLWASSYLVENRGIDAETAAGFASFFYIGITLGRAINGFLAMKFSDHFLIRCGLGIILTGIALLFLPFHASFALIGFIVIGLGCAPVYPCIIHMTPSVFGKEKSQAMIGVQMAFAYTGFMIMPPLFGFIASSISIALLPVYLLALLLLMFIMHELVVKNIKAK